ncbi:MAG: phosphotransferase [Candidatus Thorarchaeota archaeon]|nr:MAG: phosphotransferase [Candidatus Thorarchaeota archaeon]RLI55662.1 MAG: phosphotransferase [Candidatus Thorarchaeota archaeon]
MERFNADLHIHSLHSIGVSKKMTIEEIAKSASKKGLHLVGTGDATQPDWLTYLESSLSAIDSTYMHESVWFILTTEIEDSESIHHVVLLPDFEAVHNLRKALKNHSPNLDHKWGGRPRVNLRGEELAGIVRDTGGLIGPAHAFTPFRSIFRENKHTSLESCYGSETSHVHFLELGLSADSEIADCIPELRRLTYITSSDAHSPSPNKLGREFVQFEMEEPSFDELEKAIRREGGRGPTLNVGLDPRLGKYFLSFCSSCRRTLIIREGDEAPSYDELNVYIYTRNELETHRLLADIHERRVKCPADGRPLRLGVRDRAAAIGEPISRSPPHRPPYIRTAPLLDVIAVSLGVKSAGSKSALKLYDRMREEMGSEIAVLTTTPIDDIERVNQRVAMMIAAYRNGTAKYRAGGGGRYGSLIPPWESETR